MKDEHKTKKQLVDELAKMRQRISEFEALEIRHKSPDEALRASEKKYRTLLENLPQKIFHKDVNSVYVSCNENYARDLKIRPDEIVGKTDYDFYPKELAQKYRADDKRIMESGETENLEEKYIQGGREVIVNTVKTPIRDEKGKTVGILGIFWDITERKRVENELHDSGKRFKDLARLLPQNVFETDERGNITFMNRGKLDYFGYTEEDFKKGFHFLQFLVPEDRDRAIKNRRRRLGGEKLGPVEYTVLRKDGSTCPVIQDGSPIIRDNRVVGLRGIIVDITDIKQAQYALRESEEKYRTLAESSLTGIFIHLGGKFIFVNDRFAEIHGYTPEELMGKPYITLIHQDDRETIKEIVSMRLKGKVPPMRYEIRRLRKDGRTIWCEMMATRIMYRGKPAIMGNVLDITERKRTERALKESEQRYRNLFENAYDAIFITDTKTGKILDANRQAEKLVGHPKEEIVGMHQSRLHPPDHYEHYKQMFRRRMRKGHVLDLEAEVVRKDGTIIPVLISASAISLGERQVTQGIFRDITKEKGIVSLKEEIADKRLIEKAKEILMDRRKISEKEAIRLLQRESRRQSRKMKEIARDVISSRSLLS